MGRPGPGGRDGRKGRDGFDALFALKRPCSDCPFKPEGGVQLMRGRLQGIIDELLANDWSTFLCHKSVHSAAGGEWSEDAGYTASGRETHCMGAVGFLHNVGRPSVPMRVGYTIGKLQSGDVVASAAMVIQPSKNTGDDLNAAPVGRSME